MMVGSIWHGVMLVHHSSVLTPPRPLLPTGTEGENTAIWVYMKSVNEYHLVDLTNCYQTIVKGRWVEIARRPLCSDIKMPLEAMEREATSPQA